MLKKSLQLWIISYLVARLEIVFEISRLTLLRFRPRARVDRLVRQDRRLDRGQWAVSRNFVYYMTLEDAPRKPCIWEISELHPN